MYGQCGIHPSRVYCKKWGCFEMGLPHYTSLHYNNYYQVNCSKSWWIYPLRLEIMEYGAVPVCKSPSKTGSQEKQQYTRNNIIKHYIYICITSGFLNSGRFSRSRNQPWTLRPYWKCPSRVVSRQPKFPLFDHVAHERVAPNTSRYVWVWKLMQCMQIHIFFGWFSNFLWLEWIISTMFDD